MHTEFGPEMSGRDVANISKPKQREGDKKIMIQSPRNMVGSGAGEAADTEAITQRKQPGSKRVKTRAQKDKHNESCLKSRLKKKRRFEELQKLVTKYTEMVPKLQAELESKGAELEQYKSKLLCVENDKEELSRALEEKAANEDRMRQIPTGWKVNGRNFGSFNELIEWVLSLTNEQVGQGSGISATVLQDANEFVGLGTTGTGNFQPSMADFYHQMGSGPDYTNITASAAGRPSFVSNHDFPFGFGTPNNHVNDNLYTHGLVAGNRADHYLSLFDAPNNHYNLFNHGPATDHYLPLFDAPNNHYNLFNYGPATGVLTNSAAGSSFGANPDQ